MPSQDYISVVTIWLHHIVDIDEDVVVVAVCVWVVRDIFGHTPSRQERCGTTVPATGTKGYLLDIGISSIVPVGGCGFSLAGFGCTPTPGYRGNRRGS